MGPHPFSRWCFHREHRLSLARPSCTLKVICTIYLSGLIIINLSGLAVFTDRCLVGITAFSNFTPEHFCLWSYIFLSCFHFFIGQWEHRKMKLQYAALIQDGFKKEFDHMTSFAYSTVSHNKWPFVALV